MGRRVAHEHVIDPAAGSGVLAELRVGDVEVAREHDCVSRRRGLLGERGGVRGLGSRHGRTGVVVGGMEIRDDHARRTRDADRVDEPTLAPVLRDALVAEVRPPADGSVVGGPARLELGQLGGGASVRLQGDYNDGAPERALATWLVRAKAGDTVEVEARHPRAGTVRATVTLGG